MRINGQRSTEEIQRQRQHAASLRRMADGWLEEQTRPNRSGNIGRDCKALGWNSPDEIYRSADLADRSADAMELASALPALTDASPEQHATAAARIVADMTGGAA